VLSNNYMMNLSDWAIVTKWTVMGWTI
jgi:hypothetical protein